MTDAPKRIWATGTTTSGSWNDAPLTMRNPPPQTEYHRADLSADLVAEIADFLEWQCEYSAAAELRNNPEAIALIVARVTEGK